VSLRSTPFSALATKCGPCAARDLVQANFCATVWAVSQTLGQYRLKTQRQRRPDRDRSLGTKIRCTVTVYTAAYKTACGDSRSRIGMVRHPRRLSARVEARSHQRRYRPNAPAGVSDRKIRIAKANSTSGRYVVIVSRIIATAFRVQDGSSQALVQESL